MDIPNTKYPCIEGVESHHFGVQQRLEALREHARELGRRFAVLVPQQRRARHHRHRHAQAAKVERQLHGDVAAANDDQRFRFLARTRVEREAQRSAAQHSAC